MWLDSIAEYLDNFEAWLLLLELCLVLVVNLDKKIPLLLDEFDVVLLVVCVCCEKWVDPIYDMGTCCTGHWQVGFFDWSFVLSEDIIGSTD
jgi:hypothetical protein